MNFEDNLEDQEILQAMRADLERAGRKAKRHAGRLHHHTGRTREAAHASPEKEKRDRDAERVAQAVP
jgi:hypothetical protein